MTQEKDHSEPESAPTENLEAEPRVGSSFGPIEEDEKRTESFGRRNAHFFAESICKKLPNVGGRV